MSKRFKVIQIETSTKTVNQRYDPTSLTIRTGTKVIGYYDTLEGAGKVLIKRIKGQEEADMMNRAMGAQLDSEEYHELVGDSDKLIIVDRVTGDMYNWEWTQRDDLELVKVGNKNDFDKMYPTNFKDAY